MQKKKQKQGSKTKDEFVFCQNIFYEYMQTIPQLITQAIFSNDLVNVLSWSINYYLEENNDQHPSNKNKQNILNFIYKSSDYLSPLFNTNTNFVTHSIVKKYFMFLMNEYLKWKQNLNIIIYANKRRQLIGSLIRIILNHPTYSKYLIVICYKNLFELIYTFTMDYILHNIPCTNDIISILRLVQTITSNTLFKNKNKNNNDYQLSNEPPLKKIKLNTTEHPNKDFDTSHYTLTESTSKLTQAIFEKKFIAPQSTDNNNNNNKKNIILNQIQSGFWNDYMISLMIEIMCYNNYSTFGYNVMRYNPNIAKLFILQFVKYISKVPLRYSKTLKQKILKLFISNTVFNTTQEKD